jgi:hypothetical protein
MSLSKDHLRLIVSIFAAGLLAAGCGNIKVRAGYRPDVAALEQRLVMLQSTKAEVARVLGDPFGQGGSQMPTQPKAHTLWSYYYEEGTLSDDRRMFLFVYFNPDGLYDGYMWFSSLPQQSSLSVPASTAAAQADPMPRVLPASSTGASSQPTDARDAGNLP